MTIEFVTRRYINRVQRRFQENSADLKAIAPLSPISVVATIGFIHEAIKHAQGQPGALSLAVGMGAIAIGTAFFGVNTAAAVTDTLAGTKIVPKLEGLYAKIPRLIP